MVLHKIIFQVKKTKWFWLATCQTSNL